MALSRRAIRIAGIAGALTVSALALYGGWPRFGVPDPAPEGAGDRLAFAMRWMLIPALSLLNGLGATHLQRMTNPKATDGENAGAGRILEVVLRYNTNTLEQGFLALVAWCGLALTLPGDHLFLIPRLAVLFGAGRALFLWGYLWTPPARIFGMGLTAYPIYGALTWLVWRTFFPE